MKTIDQIYQEYRIMKSLQNHMYRVTAVASLICDRLKIWVDKKSVISTCLLHDMGNILKSDFSVFPEFVEPEGVEYWKKVKSDFKEKYFTENSHLATLSIAVELNATLRTLELLNFTNVEHAESIASIGDIESKICIYADMRVGPHGLLSLDERITDLKERYTDHPEGLNIKEIEEGDVACQEIERQIFKFTDITPLDINESSINPLIVGLKNSFLNSSK